MTFRDAGHLKTFRCERKGVWSKQKSGGLAKLSEVRDGL